MEFKNIVDLKGMAKRILAGFVSASMMITFFPLGIKVKAAATIPTITNYQPTITESIDSSGFKHPGIGLTKDILESMRAEIIAQKEPWYSYYKGMLESSSAAATVTSSNASSSDPTKAAIITFDSQGFNSKFIADGLKAYTQALLYYITGDETYRSNAMNIIRIWEQMDPTKYAYFTDACIHTGIPLNRMVTAAEILRYSSCKTESLKWTEQDTTNFTNNLITPVIETFQHDNNHFMNQHLYPLLGAMAGYIFTGNKTRYDEGVEWFTVNKTAVDQGQNGAVKQLFRLVDTDIVTGEKLAAPRVQHVEMGRDQAHGNGDLTNVAIITRMFLAQGTKVDPNDGTISTKADAVGPYEFLNNRILKAVDYFWQYMLGYDTPWTPVAAHTDANGNPTIIYREFSDFYRGRMTLANFWDIYYYYKYTAGIDMAKEAPYFEEAFHKRLPSNFYYQGALTKAWDSADGGADFWAYLPKSVEAEGAQNLPKEQPSNALIQLEERYTSFDNNSTTKTDSDGTSFIEVNATEGGSKFAPLNLSYPDRTKPSIIGLRFRTNSTAKLEMSKEINGKPYIMLTLPDTRGQWEYITYDMGVNNVSFAQIDKDYSIQYFNIKGSGTTVDLDALNVKTTTSGSILTAPAFKYESKDLNIFAYVGSSTPVTYDFSATDSNPFDAVTYQIDNKPQGASLDASTGAFSWALTQAGTYSFIVSASDGTTVSAKSVNAVVTNDRKSAVTATIASYNENTSYESVTGDAYIKAYDGLMSIIDSGTDVDFYQGLSRLKTAVDNLKLLNPLLNDGSLDFSDIVSSNVGVYTKMLIDNNTNSFPNTSLAPDLNNVFDFGPNFKVSATAFKLQVRRSFPERLAGSTVFGSNDGVNWTRLTDGTTQFNEDLQTLQVKDEYKNAQFRFIKVEMINPQPSLDPNITANNFEMSEFRILGQRYEMDNKIQSVSISSDQSINGRILVGNTVKLKITAKEAINNVKVKIQGQDAAVSTTDNINWTAVATLNQGVATGNVILSIDYQKSDGTSGDTAYFTTDNSKLFLADESDLIRNVTGITNLIDSTSARTAASTLTQVNYLFDNNATTCSDFRIGSGSGTASYIIFDFKQGNQATLSSVEILARQDTYYGRIKGTIVQGSNDNSTWTTLTTAALATADWQAFSINSKVPYRYIRIYNSTSWYGNMAEVRFHGVVKPADLTAPVTTDDAPQGWVNKDTKVTFNATDADSGVATTHFKVDGGAQQTGSSVTLSTEGTHTVVYWSVDYAGNVEQPHTATIKVDKTAPEITVDGFDKESLSDSLVIVPTVTLKDNLSGVDTNKIQLLLDGGLYQEGENIQLYKLPLGTHTFIVNSSDLAGNTGSHTVTFVTFASVEGIKQLVVRFAANNWIDNEGITNSLQKKLQQNDLQSFIQEVQAQSDKHINSEAASYLLRDAHALLP